MNLGDAAVIAAVRTDEEFENALVSGAALIFDLGPDLLTFAGKVDAAHKLGKKLFVHLDLATGIGKDKSGITFLKKIGADGVISTRTNVIKMAREAGLFTVQRFFIVDSQSVETTLESLKSSKADMIEVMPGVVTKVIKNLRSRIDIPIIAGGLIETKEEVKEILSCGATAISTGKSLLWNR